jgi:hypothetical protein
MKNQTRTKTKRTHKPPCAQIDLHLWRRAALLPVVCEVERQMQVCGEGVVIQGSMACCSELDASVHGCEVEGKEGSISVTATVSENVCGSCPVAT